MILCSSLASGIAVVAVLRLDDGPAGITAAVLVAIASLVNFAVGRIVD